MKKRVIQQSEHRKVLVTYEQILEMEMTPTQREVFIYVDEWWKKFGYSPSLRDIAEFRGKGLGPTYRVVQRLIKIGALKQVKGMGRTIRPTYINFKFLE